MKPVACRLLAHAVQKQNCLKLTSDAIIELIKCSFVYNSNIQVVNMECESNIKVKNYNAV